MDQQNGLFGFLENHVMGPMGKLAQFKVVWQLYHLLLLAQCSWYLVFCHKPSHSGQL